MYQNVRQWVTQFKQFLGQQTYYTGGKMYIFVYTRVRLSECHNTIIVYVSINVTIKKKIKNYYRNAEQKEIANYVL